MFKCGSFNSQPKAQFCGVDLSERALPESKDSETSNFSTSMDVGGAAPSVGDIVEGVEVGGCVDGLAVGDIVEGSEVVAIVEGIMVGGSVPSVEAMVVGVKNEGAPWDGGSVEGNTVGGFVGGNMGIGGAVEETLLLEVSLLKTAHRITERAKTIVTELVRMTHRVRICCFLGLGGLSIGAHSG